jgi:glycosyltransferase involved in cell wall biosynthesis
LKQLRRNSPPGLLARETQPQMAPSRKFDAPPRVLIVSPQPFYEDRGTPIAVLQVAAALSALNCEVDVLAYPVGKSVSLPNMRLQRSRNLFGIRDVRIGFSFKKILLDLGMLGSLPSLLQSGRFDVVHVLEEMALPVIFLCRRSKLPVIYDMQSSLPDQLRTNAICRLRPVQFMLRKVEDWMLSRATAVICSAGLLHHVKARAPQALAYEWTFAGQPRDETQRPGALRARLGFAADAKIILYCGTFETYQGIDLFLAAIPDVVKAIPNAVALLVGATPADDLMGDPSVSELVLQGRLHILPRQPRHTIPSYLAMADVLVSPRAYGDNVPLKIFDYLLSGKPIVATDIRAHRSVLNEQIAKLVACSPAAIAEGINDLLLHEDDAARMAKAALDQASAAPGKQAFIDLVESLYASALSDKTKDRLGRPVGLD